MESKNGKQSTEPDSKSVNNRKDNAYAKMNALMTKAHLHVQSHVMSDIESRTKPKREIIASKVYELSQDEEFKSTTLSEFEQKTENNTDKPGYLETVNEINENISRPESTHRALSQNRPISRAKPKHECKQNEPKNDDHQLLRRRGSPTYKLSHTGQTSRRRESLTHNEHLHPGQTPRRRESLILNETLYTGHTPRRRESLTINEHKQPSIYTGQTPRRRESLTHNYQTSRRRESILLDNHENQKVFHNNIDHKRRRGSHYYGHTVKDGEMRSHRHHDLTRKRVSWPKVSVMKDFNTNHPKLKTVARVIIICNLLNKYKSGEEK